MYVISSRSRRVPNDGEWVLLQSADGTPPAGSAAPADAFPSEFISSLQDPLVIVIHGYNNTELETFQQYVRLIGSDGSQGLLGANGFTGSAIGYDWPSVEAPASGPLQVYENDLKSARRIGAPAFANFFSALSSGLAAAGKNVRINLLVHSMGNLLMRTVLEANPCLAGQLANVLSLAPDLPHTDLERPGLKAAGDALKGKWFAYWAQADLILLTLSDYANIILGSELWGGQRLGQQGPAHPAPLISQNVVTQQWDAPLAKQIGYQYNWDLGEWPHSFATHSAYWTNMEFLKNIVQNIQRAPGVAPITVDWPPG
jgi:hypothetical protein